MRLRLLKSLSGWWKFRTLHQRLAFVIVIETTVSLLLVALTSYYTIHSIEQNKLKTSMVSDLQQLTEKMNQHYMNMIQISQQMSPEGTVGSLLGRYFEEDSNYERYRIGQQISEILTTITFANTEIICRLYFDTVTLENYFYSFLPYEGFYPEEYNILKENGSFKYHALHQSSTETLRGRQVISISRKINVEDKRELIIYLESMIEAKSVIDNLSKSQGVNYVLLQLGSDNRIQYSSSEAFSMGQSFGLDEESEVDNSYFGKYGKYIGVRIAEDAGYANVLLLPSADYNRELYTWLRNIIGILFLAVFLFGISFVILSRLIYTPLAAFSKEMKRLGKGDLNMVSVHTGVVEYDELFEQFNTMKKKIQQLLLDVETVAQENHQLEIEMIYYQINPHFLMNTLHSIHWLAKMHHQTEIENFTTELNYILAYSLGKIDKETTLRTEIKMLQAYLRLQKMRYDFQAEVDVEEGNYLDTPTARMILQPIAENAIHHGLGEDGCLYICVSHCKEKNAVNIILEDNGRGLTMEELKSIQQTLQKSSYEKSKNDGIGLRYVHYMLESFYGDKAVINIESELSRGTKVTLLLPIETEKPVILINKKEQEVLLEGGDD